MVPSKVGSTRDPVRPAHVHANAEDPVEVVIFENSFGHHEHKQPHTEYPSLGHVHIFVPIATITNFFEELFKMCGRGVGTG